MCVFAGHVSPRPTSPYHRPPSQPYQPATSSLLQRLAEAERPSSQEQPGRRSHVSFQNDHAEQPAPTPVPQPQPVNGS